MNATACDIVLAGVGGQGLMLLSNVLGNASARKGLSAITAESHGLAQRGGSTSVHLRIGPGPRSPLIPFGCADLLVATEPMEALRYVEFLARDGIVVTSTRIQHPVPETAALAGTKGSGTGLLTLEPILERLRTVTNRLLAVDTARLAAAAGNPRGENVVLLGAASAVPGFPLDAGALAEELSGHVPPKSLDANRAAFDLGRREGVAGTAGW